MLQIGAIGALNLTAAPACWRPASGCRKSALSPAADSCILVFLNGGPSHLDMWDMKPDLPQEMRSEFKPIATTVPGVQVCEHLPRLRALMSKCTLVRSVHHDQVAHAPAVYTALTGIREQRPRRHHRREAHGPPRHRLGASARFRPPRRRSCPTS